MRDEIPGLLASAGPLGFAACAIGAAVGLAGVWMSVMGVSRGRALAIFAAAWFPVPLGTIGFLVGRHATLEAIVQLGPAVTPKDTAWGEAASGGALTCASLGLLLGLVGAAAALWRSRASD